MDGQRRVGSGLPGVRQRLDRWRRRHGGRGTRIPAGLWEEAVEVALQEGVAKTARVLRVDKGRLSRRVEAAGLVPEGSMPGAGFVELQVADLGSRGSDVVQFVSADGSWVHVEVAGRVDVEALARAFWDRGR